MKQIFLVCVFILVLGVALAQQSTNNLPGATNSVASDAIEQIRAKAEKGDVEAQATLAGCYFKGDGVAKDTTEAVKWLSKAANQGNAPSQTLVCV